MITERQIPMPKIQCDESKLSHFRFGEFENGVLLTTDHGAWHWLEKDIFAEFLAGLLNDDSPHVEILGEKGFIRSQTNLGEWAQAIQRRKSFLGIGPALHQIQLHNGRQPLSVETAKSIIDHAMQSTATVLEFEFYQHHGDIDSSLLDFIISYAMEKNRYENKKLLWAFNSRSFTFSDSAALALAKGKCVVNLFIEGADRIHVAGDNTAYACIQESLEKVITAATSQGAGSPMFNANLLLDSASMENVKALLVAVQELGFATVTLTPKLTGTDAVTPELYRSVYKETLNGLLENPNGIKEGNAVGLASCILRPDPSLHPERRSPGEAGLNVHAYDATGKIFPNATAFEMVNADMFQLGTVGKTAFEDVLNHPTLKTLTMASVYDCLPGFSEHWATPFLSLDPLACYAQTGNLFETLPTSSRAKVALGQLETLFAILIEGNQEKSDRLDQWISV